MRRHGDDYVAALVPHVDAPVWSTISSRAKVRSITGLISPAVICALSRLLFGPMLPAIIEFVFGDLARTPRKVGKPLEGELEGSYSARRGPCRILYNINDTANQVEILRVDQPSRRLPQRLIGGRRTVGCHTFSDRGRSTPAGGVPRLRWWCRCRVRGGRRSAAAASGACR